MVVKERSVVTLLYKLSEESGKVIDSSDTNGALTYLHGVGMMMPGIEKAVEGLKEKSEYTGVIEPEDAYGIFIPENVVPVPKSHFEHLIDQMEEGKLYNFDVGGGNTKLIKVVKIDNETVTIDANHPYAGERIKIECTVESVREATEDELNSINSRGGCGCGSHGNKKGGCCSTKGSGEKKSHCGSGCGCSH